MDTNNHIILSLGESIQIQDILSELIDQVNALCLNINFKKEDLIKAYGTSPDAQYFDADGGSITIMDTSIGNEKDVLIRFEGENKDVSIRYIEDKLAPNGSLTVIADGEDHIIAKYLLNYLGNGIKKLQGEGLKYVFRAYSDTLVIQFLDGKIGIFKHPDFTQASNFKYTLGHLEFKKDEICFEHTLTYDLQTILKYTKFKEKEQLISDYFELGMGEEKRNGNFYLGHTFGIYPFNDENFIGVGGFSGYGKYDSGGQWPLTLKEIRAEEIEKIKIAGGQWLVDLIEKGVEGEALKNEMLKHFFKAKNVSCYWLS